MEAEEDGHVVQGEKEEEEETEIEPLELIWSMKNMIAVSSSFYRWMRVMKLAPFCIPKVTLLGLLDLNKVDPYPEPFKLRLNHD